MRAALCRRFVDCLLTSGTDANNGATIDRRDDYPVATLMNNKVTRSKRALERELIPLTSITDSAHAVVIYCSHR